MLAASFPIKDRHKNQYSYCAVCTVTARFPRLLARRTITKQTVAAEITESIVRNTGTDPKYIYVIFEDVAPSDWAGEGKLFGD